MGKVIKWGVRIAALISASSLIAIPFGHCSQDYMTLSDCIMLLVWGHMEWEIWLGKK
ncbi:hypothetical protein Pat9b_5082 (plasmid) [Pantoea sp. At-9b]|nr:hypothetical protein Pat9b_5082 [Pantoea sp. At-9b]